MLIGCPEFSRNIFQAPAQRQVLPQLDHLAWLGLQRQLAVEEQDRMLTLGDLGAAQLADSGSGHAVHVEDEGGEDRPVVGVQDVPVAVGAEGIRPECVVGTEQGKN